MGKRNIVRDSKGRVLYEHYYLAGGHVYEVPRGKGKKRAKACFEETPTGDGRLLWEEEGGCAALEAAKAIEAEEEAIADFLVLHPAD